MKNTTGKNPRIHGGTAASAFHLSGTIDWSSLSAQIKNRKTVIEVQRLKSQNEYKRSKRPERVHGSEKG